MPYISETRRKDLANWARPTGAGELNYVISKHLVDYVKDHGLSYSTCNDIIGAIDNAKSEFKRRVQDPYEDRKIDSNGDIGYADLLV